MLMNPTVSVVIPSFNYGHFLAGAVRSVLGQTFRALEVLVVDDGSTDDTALVAAGLLGDGRVRYLHQSNQGPAAARNLGIEFARGPLIAFLDADDRWLPTKLERQLALFKRKPTPGVVCCRRQWIDPDGRPVDRPQPALRRGWVLPQLFRDNFVCFSSAIFRRSALLEAGGFDQLVEHAEDYDLLLRVARRHPMDFVDEPLVQYRTGHGNLSSQTEKRFTAVCDIMRRFLDDGGRGQVPALAVRRAWSETYCHWGCAVRRDSWWRAMRMQLRALGWLPWLGEAWWELASLCLPHRPRKRCSAQSPQPPLTTFDHGPKELADLACAAPNTTFSRP